MSSKICFNSLKIAVVVQHASIYDNKMIPVSTIRVFWLLKRASNLSKAHVTSDSSGPVTLAINVGLQE